mmetsp:Transcript_17331/g.66049  ORF Transcript_17331/g.66049 Transcript_17331/m.66049 type:complete len:145 (-) Transcript_17331:29-463(-)
MADAFDEARRVPSFVVDGERLSDFRRALLVKEIGAQTRRRQRPGEPPKSAAQEETLPFDPQRPFDAELDKFPAEISDNMMETLQKMRKEGEAEAEEHLREVRELQRQKDELVWLLAQVSRVEQGERQLATLHKVDKVVRQGKDA